MAGDAKRGQPCYPAGPMNRLCWLLPIALAACAKSGSGDSKPETKDKKPAAGARAPAFQLVCGSSDTKASTSLFCVRMDTRNGDVKRVAWDHIPVSQGPTKAADGPAGRYQLVCDATASETVSDFYCLRLDTESGEMLLVQLPKLGVIPEDAARHDHGGGVHSH